MTRSAPSARSGRAQFCAIRCAYPESHNTSPSATPDLTMFSSTGTKALGGSV